MHPLTKLLFLSFDTLPRRRMSLVNRIKDRPGPPTGYMWVQDRVGIKKGLAPILIKTKDLDEAEHITDLDKPPSKRMKVEAFPAVYQAPTEKPQRSPKWKDALWQSTQPVYFEDDVVKIIYDGYPKAKRHLLALAPPGPLGKIQSVEQLRKMHLKALRLFHDRCRACAEHLRNELPPTTSIKVGYHSEPSLNRLHCHIISDDLDSECLTKKKHYISFATDYFIDVATVERLLEETPDTDFSARAFRTELHRRAKHDYDLTCLHCAKKFSTFPQLKKHLPCKHPSAATFGAGDGTLPVGPSTSSSSY